MPIALIMDFKDLDAEAGLAAYDAVLADLDLDANPPAGAVFHAAGAFEGHLRVIDVWESDEAFGAFREARLGPATAKHGLNPPGAERFEVGEPLGGAGGRPGLLQVVRLPFGIDAFREMHAKVLPDGTMPEGGIVHVHGTDEDGNAVVLDAWTSADARDAFLQARVIPNIPEGAGTPRIEDLALHNARRY